MTDQDPIGLFRKWYLEAAGVLKREHTAMTLATTGKDGSPSARIVLLKDFDEKGFVFYSNYQSLKSVQLDENPRAALVFYWPECGYQVRMEGRVVRTSPDESDSYFTSRPRGSRLGAWASPQSRIIGSREELDEAVSRMEREFEGKDIPRPPFWGGYRLVPERMEFWTEKENRLHDRILFSREIRKINAAGDNFLTGEWSIERLAP